MKPKTQSVKLYRQGDVLFTPIAALPSGNKKRRENGTVAYGEVTGHSHTLAEADRESAVVWEMGDGLYVHVSDDSVRIEGATFVHEEHGPITLPPGNYRVTIQREYQPGSIRDVLD